MKFRKIYTEFWEDGWMEKQSPETRYFMLFLMTNPFTTQLGIYEISLRKMEFYTGYNREAVEAILTRLIEAEKIKYDLETEELMITNWGKYNLSGSGKPIIDCLKSELEKVKRLDWLPILAKDAKGKGIKELLLSWHDTSTMRGQEEEKEKEEEQEKEKEEEQEEQEDENPFSSQKSVLVEMFELAKKKKYLCNFEEEDEREEGKKLREKIRSYIKQQKKDDGYTDWSVQDHEILLIFENLLDNAPKFWTGQFSFKGWAKNFQTVINAARKDIKSDSLDMDFVERVKENLKKSRQ